MSDTEFIEKSTKAVPKTSGETAVTNSSNNFYDLTDGSTGAGGLNYDYDPELIYRYAEADPIIRAAINKKSNKPICEGYSIEPLDDTPEAETEAKEFELFCKTAGGRVEDSGRQVNFLDILHNTYLGLNEGDEMYWEIRADNTGKPGEINVLDWEDMRIVLDSTNKKIAGYIQVIQGKAVASWESNEIIHKSFYQKGTKLYGNSLIRTILLMSAGRMFAYKYANNVFYNQKPKGAWAINLPDTEYTKIKDQIKEGKMNPHSDLCYQAKDEQVKYTNIATPTDMEYKSFIDGNRAEILIGLGVPPGSIYLAGETGGWEADVQLHEFDEDINMLRTFMESIVNEILIPKFGFTHIKFVINRSNKRDELKDAQIAGQLTSGILTINERRDLLGYGPIQEGDKIVQAGGLGGFGGFGNQDTPVDGANSMADNKNNQDIEGESAGDKELAKSIMNTQGNGILIDHVTYKNPNHFRKSFGALSKFNKSISKQEKIIIKKVLPKVETISESYYTELNSLLKSFIDDSVKLVEQAQSNSLFFTKYFTGINLNKILSPKEIDKVEEVKRKFLAMAVEVSRKHSSDAYHYGIDIAEFETGRIFNKMALSPETFDFINRKNINVVEGAFSEVAARIRTQIYQGLSNNEGTNEIAKRLKDMDGSVEEIYKNRFKTIARTESMQATTMGSIEAYKKSGLNKAQMLIGLGPDDAEICATVYEGSPGDLSKEWNLSELPKETHPNCKCVIVPVLPDSWKH